MIHVALEVMAFLFLCWVGLMLLAIVFRILNLVRDQRTVCTELQE